MSPDIDASEPIYFDAVLTPNRSLSTRGFTIVMLAFGAVSFLTGLMFFAAGALPVVGFLGLDVLLLWIALRAVRRQQAQETRVQVTASHIRLRHTRADGSEAAADIPAAFARAAPDRPGQSTSGLRISHAGQAWIIGRYLSQAECEDLARAVNQAMRKARAPLHPA